MGTSARNAAIHINGYTLSTSFSEEESTHDCGLEDTTAFGSTVVGKSWTPTLAEAMLTLRGFWTAGANQVWRILKAALGTTTKSIVCVWHAGDTAGNRGIGMQADISTLKVPAAVGSVLKIEAEFKSSVGEEALISLHAMSQETTFGNGPTHDNGAATTAGGSAYLHVEDVGTNMTAIVYHSTDNFATDDSVLGIFSVVSADHSSERITFSGTINQYTRVEWVQNGNTTFAVGLHRN